MYLPGGQEALSQWQECRYQRLPTGEVLYPQKCLSPLRLAVAVFETPPYVANHKVNTQCLLYCLVHNIGKIHRYAPELG